MMGRRVNVGVAAPEFLSLACQGFRTGSGNNLILTSVPLTLKHPPSTMLHHLDVYTTCIL